MRTQLNMSMAKLNRDLALSVQAAINTCKDLLWRNLNAKNGKGVTQWRVKTEFAGPVVAYLKQNGFPKTRFVTYRDTRMGYTMVIVDTTGAKTKARTAAITNLLRTK